MRASSADQPKENIDYDEIGDKIIQSETIGEISYGLPIKELVKAFGEPEEKTKPEMWGADSKYHQIHCYFKQDIEIFLTGNSENSWKADRINF